MTLAPDLKAARMRVRAGSMPPMSSMTMSLPVATAVASSVRRARGTALSRGAPRSRTAMPVISMRAPLRAAKSSACSRRSRTTWVPTVPEPRTPTRSTGRPLGREGVGWGCSVTGDHLALKERVRRRARTSWPSIGVNTTVRRLVPTRAPARGASSPAPPLREAAPGGGRAGHPRPPCRSGGGGTCVFWGRHGGLRAASGRAAPSTAPTRPGGLLKGPSWQPPQPEHGQEPPVTTASSLRASSVN